MHMYYGGMRKLETRQPNHGTQCSYYFGLFCICRRETKLFAQGISLGEAVSSGMLWSEVVLLDVLAEGCCFGEMKATQHTWQELNYKHFDCANDV